MREPPLVPLAGYLPQSAQKMSGYRECLFTADASAPAELRGLDIKGAFLQVDGFTRAAFLRAPPKLEPSDACRFWGLNAPAYGLNDAQEASNRSLQRRHSGIAM